MSREVVVSFNLDPGDARSIVMKYSLTFYPHCKMVDKFKDAMISSLNFHLDSVSDKHKISIQLLKDNDEPWLPYNGNPYNMFFVCANEVINNKRWTVIDRVKQICFEKYVKDNTKTIDLSDDSFSMLEQVHLKNEKRKGLYEQNIDKLLKVIVKYLIEV